MSGYPKVCKMGTHVLALRAQWYNPQTGVTTNYRQCTRCWAKFGAPAKPAEAPTPGLAAGDDVCTQCRMALHKNCTKHGCVCNCERGY